MKRLFLKPAVFVVVAFFVVVGACGRRRGGSSTTGGEAVALGGGTVVAHGTPAEQLTQYNQLMQTSGYSALQQQTTSALIAGGLGVFTLSVNSGYCYAIAAFGPDASDVNMFILDPLGRDVGHDIRPDFHPWTSFCARRRGRFTVRVQMMRGQGVVQVATHAKVSSDRVNLAAFFGGGDEAREAVQLDAPTQARVAAMDQRLSSDRFVRVGEPAGELLQAGDQRDFQVQLEQGICYAFAAFAANQSGLTRMSLVDSDGHSLATGEGQGAEQSLRYCAAATGSNVLQVRLEQAPGALYVAAYSQAAANTPSQPAATPTTAVLASQSTRSANADESYALVDADMRARGYEPLAAAERQQVEGTAATSFQVSLEGNKCYAITAVGDAALRNMQLVLSDDSGRELDRDDAGGNRPTVRVCPSAELNAQISVRAESGSGPVVLQSYRWPRGIRGPFGLSGLTFVRLSEMTAQLSAEGFSPDINFELQQSRLRREGAHASHAFNLEGGKCYSIVVVGGEGVRDVGARLTRNGSLVTSDTSRTAATSLRVCADQSGSYSLDVDATSGAGPYLYQIFVQGQ